MPAAANIAGKVDELELGKASGAQMLEAMNAAQASSDDKRIKLLFRHVEFELTPYGSCYTAQNMWQEKGNEVIGHRSGSSTSTRIARR